MKMERKSVSRSAAKFIVSTLRGSGIRRDYDLEEDKREWCRDVCFHSGAISLTIRAVQGSERVDLERSCVGGRRTPMR